ncbi:hypothetical protein ASPZODRAFT_70688 [Penicilliopsis zonata CBS 506.65]|uniref:N(6)-L-threonylcarbamoyladenine synthase n=1 Tax=Penicilliopsis zonata CBS 506.65 TaxID=1073090 RepID=A0A1L9SCI4_9EURO|nr:hypothetical protein ASPZODRAFT_70688 [Penicilliopsis zonata CBS 506.65]OJJ44896.1 hypothetical protein ASPZODRAFT_70688 [Penicilliopsis zonata CBS 506.65]
MLCSAPTSVFRSVVRSPRLGLGVWRQGVPSVSRRCLLTLAIESSCDDTSVAILEKEKNATKIHFLENVTADTREYGGIHPIVALESHHESMSKLVNKALHHLPLITGGNSDGGGGQITLAGESQPRRKPDLVAATRGPGMRSNLTIGLETGKALSVAWQVPFVGVHHMQAHLLTPRLVASLEGGDGPTQPKFPFLSILVSGGHSILVRSTSIVGHQIMAESSDIAIGEALDKTAREVLPPSLLENAKNTMYGKMLEQFAFPNGAADYTDYRPPRTRGEEFIKKETPWGWALGTPFANTRTLEFSFASVASRAKSLIVAKTKAGVDVSLEERRALARESMRVAFEHLASRTIIALETLRQDASSDKINTLVVSGGVAANRFLMTVLRGFLDVRGFDHVRLVAPPPRLCTDNAAMIGWAGIEMFEAGWHTDLGTQPVRKWALDAQADDGGILGVGGWIRKM